VILFIGGVCGEYTLIGLDFIGRRVIFDIITGSGINKCKMDLPLSSVTVVSAPLSIKAPISGGLLARHADINGVNS
jgi:hypothetical protein